MNSSTARTARTRSLFTALLLTLAALALAPRASAAPTSRILRVDPVAGVQSGQPLLTTVVEVVEFHRLSDALMPCANVTGTDATMDCWSNAVEKPGALWSPFPFPEANANFFVNVGGSDTPTQFESKVQWGSVVGKDPRVGTAWLIALDASSGMGGRYEDAREIATAFIKAMQPQDLVDLMIFDDRAHQYLGDSKWKTYAQRNDIMAVLNKVASTSPSHGPDRPLFSQIKEMVQNAFGDLGGSQAPDTVPLHQAMVVLSDGAGRGDAESASPSADVFHQYLDQGRFPPDNTSLPKTPLPVISIWLPGSGGIVNNLYKNNDSQFMQALANPEIGGYFDIVRQGQWKTKANTIVGLVKQRFNAMWIVKWKLACLNPTVTQSFNLVFANTKPLIAPDGSFKDVPIGVDPSQWPLAIDVQRTAAEAQTNPVYPGGTFRVYGDFCWSGDKSRAEAYFVPAGTKPDPRANSPDLNLAKQAMQQLIAQNMRGAGTDVGDAFATFTVPSDDKILEGTGDNTVARVVIYDNKAHRASGHDEKSILTLKAKGKPFNVLLVAGIAGGLIVIGLLLVVAMRGGGGGGGGKKRGMTPPPAPIVAGGGGPPYGGPPGNYQGGNFQAAGFGQASPAFGMGGGMGGGAAISAMPPSPAMPMSPMNAAPAPMMAPPQPAMAAMQAAPAAVVQVQCPACHMMTMATPGQPSVCFSCGQPLPASVVGAASLGASGQGGGGGGYAPGFPLTGGLPVPPQPPANPYGVIAGGASILGAAGQFSIRPGSEVKVGRDPAQCPVLLNEPRVSGVHATLKFEGGRLWVRDESSNNGVYVDGARIAAATWTPVGGSSALRFGPIDFAVRLDP